MEPAREGRTAVLESTESSGSNTSTDEQRSTQWMQFHSLAQFLDPQDPDKTIEGYPAPRRAIITANKA